jgi:hypothetical protein
MEDEMSKSLICLIALLLASGQLLAQADFKVTHAAKYNELFKNCRVYIKHQTTTIAKGNFTAINKRPKAWVEIDFNTTDSRGEPIVAKYISRSYVDTNNVSSIRFDNQHFKLVGPQQLVSCCNKSYREKHCKAGQDCYLDCKYCGGPTGNMWYSQGDVRCYSCFP